jgi:E3 ubiquitin-protein ligase RFWD2
LLTILFLCLRIETDDGLEAFSTTLYQMTRYSKWVPLDSIHYADISTNSAIVSSIEFNRDEDYIAVGGVAKEIKIYDFGMVNERVDERATQLADEEAEVERTDGSFVKARRLPHSTTINTSRRTAVPAMVHCPLQTIDCDFKIR